MEPTEDEIKFIETMKLEVLTLDKGEIKKNFYYTKKIYDSLDLIGD